MRRETPSLGSADGEACGCPESNRAFDSDRDPTWRGFSRRAFLQRSAVVAAATGLSTRGLATQLAFASSPTYTGDVLIVLSFRGGFDGLSVVVPRNDPDFIALRPNIRVPDGQMLATGDSRFGLHPAMAPLMPMWNAGTFGAVHAVGQVNPTRSHFEATEELEKAAPGSSLRTGWLDRMLGDRGAAGPFQACQVGSTEVSPGFAGPMPVLGMYNIDGFGLSGADGDLATWDAALRAVNATAPMTVQAPVATTLGALATITSLGTVDTYTPANGAVYDVNSDLSKALRDVARMMKAGIGLQTVAIDYDDWDMHAGLSDTSLNPTTGWMHDKVTEFSTALANFFMDLGPSLTAKTSLITLSEFGRRVEENGSYGLDHGHGNAVLLLGGGIVGGAVHGSWPGLSDAALDDGDLAATTDYRNLLGEIMIKRCGASSVSNVFPGLTYSATGITH